MVGGPADVSSAVLTVPVGGFEPVGAIGGCVEPVVATEHHGSGAGLTVLERVEAELDRRERALTRVLAPADGVICSNQFIAYLRTYSDMVKCNMDPTPQVDSASAGVQAQVQRRPAATEPTQHNIDTYIQVPPATLASTSLPSEANRRPHIISAIHNKPDVHEYSIVIEELQNRIGGKGQWKGTRKIKYWGVRYGDRCRRIGRIQKCRTC